MACAPSFLFLSCPCMLAAVLCSLSFGPYFVAAYLGEKLLCSRQAAAYVLLGKYNKEAMRSYKAGLDIEPSNAGLLKGAQEESRRGEGFRGAEEKSRGSCGCTLVHARKRGRAGVGEALVLGKKRCQRWSQTKTQHTSRRTGRPSHITPPRGSPCSRGTGIWIRTYARICTGTCCWLCSR